MTTLTTLNPDFQLPRFWMGIRASAGETAPRRTRPASGIHAEAVYDLQSFMLITGLFEKSLRAARERGMPVRKIGKREYIVGADFLAYVVEHGQNIS